MLWLTTGADKVDALARPNRQDQTIPAGRVSREHAIVVADRAAAAGLEGH